MTPDRERTAALAELSRDGWLASAQWLDEIDSTSDEVRRQVDQHMKLPRLVVADRQSRGRGRGEHRWWSPAGCLMFTLAIDAKALTIDPSNSGQLGLLCGVAVAESLCHCATSVLMTEPSTRTQTAIQTSETRSGPTKAIQLKWPNDVLLDGKKVGGILIESARTNTATAWLIGIGVNVDIDWTSAPDDLASNATCLSGCIGSRVPVELVLMQIVCELRRLLTVWQSGDESWLGLWQGRCRLSGRHVAVRFPDGRKISGLCEGIDRFGRLKVDAPGGLHTLSSGQVTELEQGESA